MRSPCSVSSRASASTSTIFVSGTSPAGRRLLFFLLAPLMSRSRSGDWDGALAVLLAFDELPVVVDEGQSFAVLGLCGERGPLLRQ